MVVFTKIEPSTYRSNRIRDKLGVNAVSHLVNV